LQCHLATITSQAENDFIENEIISITSWIGGFQEPGTGEPADDFEWVTGEPFSYTNWDGGEPNDSVDEDCIEFRSSDGMWNDEQCGDSLPCIIECEAPPPSGPVVIIPTMGQWGMVIASVILGFFAIIRLRRIKDSELE